MTVTLAGGGLSDLVAALLLLLIEVESSAIKLDETRLELLELVLPPISLISDKISTDVRCADSLWYIEGSFLFGLKMILLVEEKLVKLGKTENKSTECYEKTPTEGQAGLLLGAVLLVVR